MTQLEAFALTWALEVPVALAAARVVRADAGRALGAALLASALTHPLVWHFNTTWSALAPWPRLLVLEAGAVVVEGFVYASVGRMRGAHAALTSLAANATSFGLGLVILRLVLPR